MSAQRTRAADLRALGFRFDVVRRQAPGQRQGGAADAAAWWWVAPPGAAAADWRRLADAVQARAWARREIGR